MSPPRFLSNLRGTFLSVFHIRPAATNGAPTVGTHRKGDLYIDNNGDLFRCIVSGTPGTWVNVGSVSTAVVTSPNGASITRTYIEEEFFIAASPFTDSSFDLLPANAFCYGVVCRVTAAIPGPTTSLQVGINGDSNRFVNTLATTLGSTGNSFKQPIPLAPFMNNAARKVRVTAVGGNPGAATGKVRVTVFYDSLGEPTS